MTHPFRLTAAACLAGLFLAPSATAEVVEFDFFADIQFSEVEDQGDLEQSVIGAILAAIPNGSVFSGSLMLEDTTPDANADPSIGDYQNAVTASNFTANGRSFADPVAFCNPQIDCRVSLTDDLFSFDALGGFDQYIVSSRFSGSQVFADFITDETGAQQFIEFPGGGGFALDAPITGQFWLQITGYDLFSGDGFLAPGDVFGPGVDVTASFLLFVPTAFQPNGLASRATRVEFTLNNLRLTPMAPVPLPAGVVLLLSSCLGVAAFGWRRRAKTLA